MFLYLTNRKRYFSYSYKTILVGGKKQFIKFFHPIKWSKKIRRLGKNTPKKTILPMLKTLNFMSCISKSDSFDTRYIFTKFGSGVKGYYNKTSYKILNDLNFFETENYEIFYYYDALIHNSFFVDKELKTNYKKQDYSIFNIDMLELEESEQFITTRFKYPTPDIENYLDDKFFFKNKKKVFCNCYYYYINKNVNLLSKYSLKPIL